MRPSKPAYKTNRVIAIIFMICSLAWLTVSIPFDFAQQKIEAQVSDPFSNTTEEKTESRLDMADDVHLVHLAEQGFSFLTNSSTHDSSNVYIAYHGKLISPPPEVFFYDRHS